MNILRGLSIDNGGSEIRILPIGQTVENGLLKMTNNFVRIDHTNFRFKETEDKLELCDIVIAPKKEYTGIIARGMTGKMYDSKSMVIDSQSTKTGSINYYCQFIYALARDAMEDYLQKEDSGEIKKSGLFMSMLKPSMGPVYDYVIATCIPIKEHSGKNDCAAKLKASIAGEYEAKFPLLTGSNTVRFRVKAENIGVVPEGGVAMSALRNMVGEDDLTIVIDIGHVSTDIALFKGKSLFGSKVISSPYAGSTLIANVRSALADEGIVLSEEQAAKVLETGFAKRGAVDVNVKPIVVEQKKLFVQNYLRGEIIQLLNMNAVNASQIQNIVPIGASMNSGSVTGSIMQSLIEECGLKDASVIVVSDNLRYANIEQTAVFTQILFQKASQRMEQSV